jgi:hypothetical protein
MKDRMTMLRPTCDCAKPEAREERGIRCHWCGKAYLFVTVDRRATACEAPGASSVAAPAPSPPQAARRDR